MQRTPYADAAAWSERHPTWAAVVRAGEHSSTVLVGDGGGGLGHALAQGDGDPVHDGGAVDATLHELHAMRTGPWSFDGVEWRAPVRFDGGA